MNRYRLHYTTDRNKVFGWSSKHFSARNREEVIKKIAKWTADNNVAIYDFQLYVETEIKICFDKLEKIPFVISE